MKDHFLASFSKTFRLTHKMAERQEEVDKKEEKEAEKKDEKKEKKEKKKEKERKEEKEKEEKSEVHHQDEGEHCKKEPSKDHQDKEEEVIVIAEGGSSIADSLEEEIAHAKKCKLTLARAGELGISCIKQTFEMETERGRGVLRVPLEAVGVHITPSGAKVMWKKTRSTPSFPAGDSLLSAIGTNIVVKTTESEHEGRLRFVDSDHVHLSLSHVDGDTLRLRRADVVSWATRQSGRWAEVEVQFDFDASARIWCEVRYAVPSALLGWSPEYTVSPSHADGGYRFVCRFKVWNGLPASFDEAEIIFCDGDQGAKVIEKKKKSLVKQLGNILNTNSRRPTYRSSTAPHCFPVPDFCLPHPPTLTSISANSDVLLHYFDVTLPSEQGVWYVDISSGSPVDGLVYPYESLPYPNVSLPVFAVSVHNTQERGLGFAFPTGKVRSAYTHDLLTSGMEDAFTLSLRGCGADETLYLPLRPQMPHESLVSVKKTRASFRLNENVLSENFAVAITNTQSAEPLRVVVEDCAFRHSNWSIRRSSHPHTKNGSDYFSFSVGPLAYNAKVEVNYVIEYTLSPSEVLASPRGEEGRREGEEKGEGKKKGQRFLTSWL